MGNIKMLLARREVAPGPFGRGWGLAGRGGGFPFFVGHAGGAGQFEFVVAQDRAGIGHSVRAVIHCDHEEVDFPDPLVMTAPGSHTRSSGASV